MSQDWDIKTCGHACAATTTPFEDGQSIFSCLKFEAEGYKRYDYSEAGWNDEAKQGIVSHWKSVYQAPPPPAPEALKRETAETMLRQFINKEDFTRKNVIYILAVMLERKRVLEEKDVQIRPDGIKIRIYEHKKTNEVFTIPDPELKLAELAEVEREVMDLLGIAPRPTAAPSSSPS